MPDGSRSVCSLFPLMSFMSCKDSSPALVSQSRQSCSYWLHAHRSPMPGGSDSAKGTSRSGLCLPALWSFFCFAPLSTWVKCTKSFSLLQAFFVISYNFFVIACGYAINFTDFYFPRIHLSPRRNIFHFHAFVTIFSRLTGIEIKKAWGKRHFGRFRSLQAGIFYQQI